MRPFMRGGMRSGYGKLAQKVNYLGSASQTTDGTSHSYTPAFNLGPLSPSRQIVIGVIGQQVSVNGVVSSLTLNGVAGVQIVAAAAGSQPCAFYYWDNVSDTTIASLTAVFSQSQARSAVFIWAIDPITPITATEKANIAQFFTGANVSATWSATLASGGFFFAITGVLNANALTWSGTASPTEVDEITVETSFIFGAAHNTSTTAAAGVVTATGSGSAGRQLLGCAFDP